ncbi:protein NETWORKED 2A-like [Zingiber officinale]|uniref:protein NETWORKED 2A-like n=1 Tax=Zingiber officinale TaxID=94328 RepID=UPI001C4BF405|nr:protein NETWORKED 2A-like [Zingiber officinale]XP_042419018.1 protein NETWORKED 2A-like [Zingiber officinale]
MLEKAESNAYSWWWASNIKAKQSKWLENNLREMEYTVTNMLQVVESDADSFAKKAELYFKRRPELISFVEDAHKAYRALAARFDRVSGELQKANHTIATHCPDQVQYAMLEEEEEETYPKAITPIDSSKVNRRTVDGLMKKRRESESSIKADEIRDKSQADEGKAQEEIHKLHEGILFLQAEKQFIKSSYENGIVKYWDIEKQIVDMYDEMCWWRDEFSSSDVLKDVEERMIMTEQALKSCEDVIVRLQEQRKTSLEQVQLEYERIRIAKEKLNALKRGCYQSEMDMTELASETTEINSTAENMAKEIDSLNKAKLDLQVIQDKIKEYFETNTESSTADIIGNIDKLVDKVAGLELSFSSQVEQINQFISVSNELEKNVENLEEEELILTKDSHVLPERFKNTQDELRKVEVIGKIIRDEESSFCENALETCHSINAILEKILPPTRTENVCDEVAFPEEEAASYACSIESHSECKDIEVTEFHDVKEELLEIDATHPLVEFLEEFLQKKEDASLKYASEVENKNENYIREMMALIGELVNVIASRDEEITLLREQLASLKARFDLCQVASYVDSCHSELMISNTATIVKDSEMSQSTLQRDSSVSGISVECVYEQKITQPFEEKLGKDVHHLLGKNLEFWLRFSTTYHYVQKLKAKYVELQADINKLDANKTEGGKTSDTDIQTSNAESESVSKRLNELKTEFLLWSEQSMLLREELEKRFLSLNNMQEEISSVVSKSSSVGALFTPHEAARLQSEVMNMKQVSSKASGHLLVGLDQIKGVQSEIERQLAKLYETFQIFISRGKHDPNKSGVALSAFLYGFKPKKPSIFSRILPIFRKQKAKAHSRV